MAERLYLQPYEWRRRIDKASNRFLRSSPWEIGKPMLEGAQERLSYRYSDSKTCRAPAQSRRYQADYIIGMDEPNIRAINYLIGAHEVVKSICSCTMQEVTVQIPGIPKTSILTYNEESIVAVSSLGFLTKTLSSLTKLLRFSF